MPLSAPSTGPTGWTSAGSLAAGTSTFRDTGLTASTAYWYRVRATNAESARWLGPTSRPRRPRRRCPRPPPPRADSPHRRRHRPRSPSAGWTTPATRRRTWWSVRRTGRVPGPSSRVPSRPGPRPTATQDCPRRPPTPTGSRRPTSLARRRTRTWPRRPPRRRLRRFRPRLLASRRRRLRRRLSTCRGSTTRVMKDADVVERSPNGTDSWTVLAGTLPPGTSSYSDTGLDASTSYFYRVRATNVAGSSTYSDVATATTQAPVPTVPAAPSGLTAAAASSTSSTCRGSTTRVMRRPTSWSARPTGPAPGRCGAGSLPAGSTSYSDTGLTASTSYFYRVRATNVAGSSTYSNVGTATTQAPVPTGPGPAPSGLAGRWWLRPRLSTCRGSTTRVMRRPMSWSARPTGPAPGRRGRSPCWRVRRATAIRA